MESLYKVGDVVKIKKLIESDDYRFGINDDMADQSGKTFEIVDVLPTIAPESKLPDDGFKYKLRGSSWAWASSMFEKRPVKKSTEPKKSKEFKTKIFFHNKKKLKFDFSL